MTNAKYDMFTRLRGSHDSNLDGDAPPIIGKYDNFQEKQSFREATVRLLRFQTQGAFCTGLCLFTEIEYFNWQTQAN